MTELRFIVPSDPVGKQRPRFNPKTKRAVTPKKTREYEQFVAFCARTCGPRPQTWQTDPGLQFRVELDFYFRDRRAPDADNAAKALLDGMNKVVFRDDRQVVELVVRKHFDKSNPRTEVSVSEVVH